MQVSVSSTNGLERQMTVTLPAQEIEQEVSKRLSRLRKTAKLPGFRPGKIPPKVIDKKFGSDVLHEIASEMINRSYVKALAEQKIEPATRPVIESSDIARGKDIEYTAVFDVFPEVARTDLEGISIEVQACEITKEDIDSTIDTIRNQHLKWNPVESAAAIGNQATIDFTGTIDGEVFEGGEATDLDVVIGEGRLLKDFETGMIGMKTGETRTLDVPFPDDYPAENLAGKTAQFEITLKELAESEMPEVNEEFVQSLGIEEGTIESFRRQVRENMQRELDSRIQATTRDIILQAMLDHNDLELPEQLVDEEMTQINQANSMQMKRQGISEGDVNIDEEKIRAEAGRRVKLGIIVRNLIETHNLKLEKPMLDRQLEQLAAAYEDKEAYMRWYVQEPQRMKQLESAALEQLVVDTLLATANSSEKIVSFSELMNPGQDSQ